MEHIGEAFFLIFCVAVFGVMALVAGVGLALWSIWLPITLIQAIIIMAVFGVCGVVFVRATMK